MKNFTSVHETITLFFPKCFTFSHFYSIILAFETEWTCSLIAKGQMSQRASFISCLLIKFWFVNLKYLLSIFFIMAAIHSCRKFISRKKNKNKQFSHSVRFDGLTINKMFLDYHRQTRDWKMENNPFPISWFENLRTNLNYESLLKALMMLIFSVSGKLGQMERTEVGLQLDEMLLIECQTEDEETLSERIPMGEDWTLVKQLRSQTSK